MKTIAILIITLVFFGIAAAFSVRQTRGISDFTPPCKDCNVIVITLTNLRYNQMSQNGYLRPTTPNLDSLAQESLVFNNAFSHSSWTLAEGISLFTSLYPFKHGVMDRYDGSVLSPNIPTFLLESLFSPTDSPYPEVLTNVIQCPEECKPKTKETENGIIYTLFAGDRFTYGICAQDLVAYYSSSAF